MALARAALKSAWARSRFTSVMRFQLPFNHAVRIHIDHLSLFMLGSGNGVAAIDVRMPMQQQPRPKDIHEAAKGFETGVRQVSPIVDAARRGMGDQDVQVTAILQAV